MTPDQRLDLGLAAGQMVKTAGGARWHFYGLSRDEWNRERPWIEYGRRVVEAQIAEDVWTGMGRTVFLCGPT